MDSGGGSKKKSKDDALPAYMTSGAEVAPFMPGWDNTIANQLAAGGYGSAPDLLTYMQQFYQPMQVPGPTPAPSTSGSGGSSGGSGSGSGGGRPVIRLNGKTYTMRDVLGGA